MTGWLIGGGIVVVLFIGFVGYACIHVGARSEKEFYERNGDFNG